MIGEEQLAANKNECFAYEGPMIPRQVPQIERYVSMSFDSLDHVMTFPRADGASRRDCGSGRGRDALSEQLSQLSQLEQLLQLPESDQPTVPLPISLEPPIIRLGTLFQHISEQPALPQPVISQQSFLTDSEQLEPVRPPQPVPTV